MTASINANANPENVPDPFAGVDRSLLAWADSNTVAGGMLLDALRLTADPTLHPGVASTAVRFLGHMVDPTALTGYGEGGYTPMSLLLSDRLLNAIVGPLRASVDSSREDFVVNEGFQLVVNEGFQLADMASELVSRARMDAAHNMADLCQSWPAIRAAFESALS